MSAPIEVSIDIGVPPTNYFLYHEKKYPISIHIFRAFSQFFEDKEIPHVIPLLEDDEKSTIEFPEKSIIDFILYCHNQKKAVSIDHSNCVYLSYLGDKYGVLQLIEDTNQYTENHLDELQYQLLSMNEGSTDVENLRIENNISTNFLNEIQMNKEKLSTLSTPSLFRIIHNYQEKKQKEEETDKIIIDFLFEYLNKHRESKTLILFQDIHFGHMRLQYFNKLLQEYGDILNFCYFPSESIQTILEKQNEIIQNELRNQLIFEQSHQQFDNSFKLIEKMNEIITNQEQQINEIKTQLSQQETKYQHEIDEIKTQLLQQQTEYQGQIQQLNGRISELTMNQSTQHQDISNKLSSINSRINQSKNAQNHLIEEKARTLNESIQNIKQEINTMNTKIDSNIRSIDTLYFV